MADYISVYITISTQTAADRVARALVEEKLAACVNVLPPARSIYRWHGHIEVNDEIILIAKSRKSLFPQIEARVRELSSYACPCIIAWPIEAGHQPYLDWIGQQTTINDFH